MNTPPTPPDGARDENARLGMRKISALIDEELPRNWGFFVMVFPFNDGQGRMNYASNAQRADVLKLMAEFIVKNSNPGTWMKHTDPPT